MGFIVFSIGDFCTLLARRSSQDLPSSLFRDEHLQYEHDVARRCFRTLTDVTLGSIEVSAAAVES